MKSQALDPCEPLRNNKFGCVCGKFYKSYAAVYTHIKSKHQNSKQFFTKIIRPHYAKNSKGRPKKFPCLIISVENLRMNVLENGLLSLIVKIQQSANDMKIIFEKDEELNDQQVQAIYQQLRQLHWENIFFDRQHLLLQENKFKANQYLSNKYVQFYQKFKKHFIPQIAARIKLTLIVLLHQNETQQKGPSLNVNNLPEIWYNIEGIKELIQKVFQEWAIIEAEQRVIE